MPSDLQDVDRDIFNEKPSKEDIIAVPEAQGKCLALINFNLITNKLCTVLYTLTFFRRRCLYIHIYTYTRYLYIINFVNGFLVIQRIYENVVLHTTKGDIHMKLFYKEVPKTVENFCVHAKNGQVLKLFLLN